MYSAPAAALTLLLVRIDNPLHALLVASGRGPPPVIHLTSAGRLLPVDIPPCRAADVRELVGRNADYGAVAFVEYEDLEGEVSAEGVPDSWETCDGPEGGAGVGAERVEVEKVDGADKELGRKIQSVENVSQGGPSSWEHTYQDVEDRQVGHYLPSIGQHLTASAGHCRWRSCSGFLVNVE